MVSYMQQISLSRKSDIFVNTPGFFIVRDYFLSRHELRFWSFCVVGNVAIEILAQMSYSNYQIGKSFLHT